jgi:hypothetical protein
MELRDVIGLGVAGNFTGHLEQAGEASDFLNVEVADTNAPKGIFPFYIPKSATGTGAASDDHFLRTFPLSSTSIRRPEDIDRLQIEPELGLLCEVSYIGGEVVQIIPRKFGAHNDCSIRREGATKISQKKNWGRASKGISDTLIDIDVFAPGGVLDHYRLTSYLERGGELHPYGVDSAVTGYSYFYGQLIDWLVQRMNQQIDEGPLESISDWLEVAGHPGSALISVGATRYTEFGETHFLETGDHSIVAVYDGRSCDEPQIRDLISAGAAAGAQGVSILRQKVE